MTIGIPDVTTRNITLMLETNGNEESMIMVTSRKDYHLRREVFNPLPPIQETSQFASAELVF